MDPNVPTHDAGVTRARPVLTAFLIGAGIAAVVVVGHAGGQIEQTAYGDGEIYRYIARNITIPAEDVHRVVVERGTSLRFGRIGLPAMMWLLAVGRDGAMAWTQSLLMIISGGLASAAAASLFPRAGPLVAVLPWIAPGFALSISGGFADATALALGLWAIRFAFADRWLLTATALASGILVKESILVLAAGIAVVSLVRRKPHVIVACIAALAPAGAWYLVVRSRYGAIPLLDPYLDDFDGNAQTPVSAILRSILHPPSMKGEVTALLHVGLVGLSAALALTSAYGMLALVAGIQVLSAGPFAWEFIGEAARVFVVLQVLVVFAVTTRLRPDLALPQARSLRIDA